MDGRSCDLGRVPAVASDGTSSIDTGSTDILPEKHSALDGASQQAENTDGLLEAGTFADVSKSAGSGVKKGLQKCATFPPSTGEVQQEDKCCDAGDAQDALTYQRSVSLPRVKTQWVWGQEVLTSKNDVADWSDEPTVKLISAMKGGRQNNGMTSPTENRHIKWAPDVYDPPVTSVCHSVNNSYQRRSKPRKKDKNKQKQKQKGRSKKKPHNTIQNSANQIPGLKDFGTSSGESAPDDLSKHEILDYDISNQEDKCGSSFLRETIAKMHFSTAEAS